MAASDYLSPGHPSLLRLATDVDTRNILFGEPRILAVAIGVALLVVAVLMIPCFGFFRSRPVRIGAAFGAGLFAVAAVIWGDLAFTRWALYDGGHGRPPGMAPLSDWLVFAGINAILTAGAGIPGGALGMVVGYVRSQLLRRSLRPASKTATDALID
jgi:hypothetical protein